jgi:hypothetical protein
LSELLVELGTALGTECALATLLFVERSSHSDNARVGFMTILISFLALTSAGVFAAHIIDALNGAANDYPS